MNELDPPPSVIELVSASPKADALWKKWLSNLHTWLLENVSKDFYLEVAKDGVNGHALKQVFGHCEAVSTTEVTLWPVPTPALYVWPSAAANMTLSSSSANDTSAGTGAQTVQVIYLDSSYVEQTSDTMNMNGQTGVTIQKDAADVDILRIQEIKVLTAGSSEENEGVIYVGTGTVTAGVPANIYGVIELHHNISLHGFYTIPAGKTAYSSFPWFSNDANQTTEGSFWYRPEGGIFYNKKHVHFKQDVAQMSIRPHLKFLEKTDLDLRSETGAGTGAMSVDLELVLVDN